MSVDLALLTWNRATTFINTMSVTLNNGGIAWQDCIWTDNGSEAEQYQRMDQFMRGFPRIHRVRYHHNSGMARGFNTSLCLSRAKYVALMGPDTIMPQGWLKLMVEYMEAIPDAGIVAIYNVPIEHVPERYRANRNIEIVNGLPVYRAMPFDHFIIRRSIFQHVGYWREDFGPYGWSDVEWLYRCEKKLPEIGLNCYVIPNVVGGHYANDGQEEFLNPGDEADYVKWKAREAASKSNIDLIHKCQREGLPYYSPF